MTRLFLAAGVAALAITAPLAAKPGGGGHGNNNAEARPGGGGGGGGQAQKAQRGGGGGQAQSFQRQRGGGGGQAQSFQRRGGGRAFQVQRVERQGGGQRFQMQRQQRAQRFAFQERGRGHGTKAAQVDRGQRMRNVERQQVRGNAMRNAERQQIRGNQMRQAQNRSFERQQLRGNRMEQVRNNQAFRNEQRGNRFERAQNRETIRNEFRANRIEQLNNGMLVRDARLGNRQIRTEDFRANARGYGVGGCPPGLESKGCMPPGQAAKLLGAPISTAASFAGLSAVPLSAQYLYPDTNDYYYRYGGDYLYRVDRSSSLIDALLPLAFGGYSPGSYLPNYYMGSSYFPSAYGFNNYGFNSFYPASYGAGYGYGYDNLCNRYVNGTIYQVDCVTGMIVDVIPLYAGGYGVGQLLPTGYGYYNVPYQYRDMYYDTSNSGYWYAPGAIYQYDPSSSMITSVAALLSPGFNIGQPLPLGYDAYNVPYGYRSTYYDTPTAWYRYNNGYIYQVDPTTQLVTAIVASILT